MYKENGQEIFVVDGHMHFWDANPENWRNGVWRRLDPMFL